MEGWLLGCLPRACGGTEAYSWKELLTSLSQTESEEHGTHSRQGPAAVTFLLENHSQRSPVLCPRARWEVGAERELGAGR